MSETILLTEEDLYKFISKTMEAALQAHNDLVIDLLERYIYKLDLHHTSMLHYRLDIYLKALSGASMARAAPDRFQAWSGFCKRIKDFLEKSA